MIAERAAGALEEQSVINLGIGTPTLVANYLDKEKYYLHTENGLLGVTWYNKLDIKLRENGEFIMPSPLRCEEMPNQKILNYKIRLDYSR